jgi:hypothetical protein
MLSTSKRGNHNKMAGILNQKYSRKNMFTNPTKRAGLTQNPNKLSEHQINQSKRKYSQKNKYVHYLESLKYPKTLMEVTHK